MKDSLVANFHWLIILYAGFSLFSIYEEKLAEIETAKQQMEETKSRMESSKRKLAEVEKFKANLEASRERVNEVVNQIEKVQKQLPTDVNDTQVQQILGSISTDLRIQNPRALPASETLNGFYYGKEYEYQAKGTFLQFLIFFEKLGKEDRILNIKSLDITHDAEYKKGRFQVLNMNAKIESYRYNKEYRESSGLQELDAKYKN